MMTTDNPALKNVLQSEGAKHIENSTVTKNININKLDQSAQRISIEDLLQPKTIENPIEEKNTAAPQFNKETIVSKLALNYNDKVLLSPT